MSTPSLHKPPPVMGRGLESHVQTSEKRRQRRVGRHRRQEDKNKEQNHLPSKTSTHRGRGSWRNPGPVLSQQLSAGRPRTIGSSRAGYRTTRLSPNSHRRTKHTRHCGTVSLSQCRGCPGISDVDRATETSSKASTSTWWRARRRCWTTPSCGTW